jgi:hypothetical protein
MNDINVEVLLQQLQSDPGLFDSLTLGQVIRFVTLASQVKNDIILAQPANLPAAEAPAILPPSVTNFLGSSTELPPAYVERCWDILKDTIWDQATQPSEQINAAFAEHGHPMGLSKLPSISYKCTLH